MNTTSETSNPPLTAPSLELAQLARALGSLPRWLMLQELSCGEARSVTELATVAGCSYPSAIKHLAVLHTTGLAVRGRGKLYQIPKQFFPTPGQPVVDYGHCQLRLVKAG